MEKKRIFSSRKRAQMLFACVLLLGVAGFVRAATYTYTESKGNDFVTITVKADYPITIALDENDFYIGTEDDSVEVTVEAETDQTLEIPDPNTFILDAGESQYYETKPEPTETLEGSGMIYFPKVDIDIDSDNTSDFGGPDDPRDFEDSIEVGSTNPVHAALKYVVVDDYYDADTNGIPGYADGYNNDGITNNVDDAISVSGPKTNEVFVPIAVKIDPPFPQNGTTIQFDYEGPDGAHIGSSVDPDGVKTWEPFDYLRIWTEAQGGRSSTNAVTNSGHYVPPDTPISITDLGITIGEEKELYVEGLNCSGSLGSESIQISVANTNMCPNLLVTDKIKFTIIKADVDVDTDNDGGYTTIERNLAEDHYEDIKDCADYPGKLMAVNDNDDDGDGIPDFADGYNLLGAVTNIDNVVTNEHFVPIVFNIPEPIDLTKAKVRLDYEDSNPLAVTNNTAGEYVLPRGALRIWTNAPTAERDGHSIANQGDYIPSGEYDAEDFGFTNGTRAVTYYLEGITNSQQVADQQILFEVDPDGDVPGQPYPGYIAADAVRVTVYDISWIDEEPNYSMKYSHSEPECDNFFLRQDEDYKDLDMYYRILPDELVVTNVNIKIYEEDTSTVVTNIQGETDGSDFKIGNNLHVQWDDARDSSDDFRSIGFYPVELVVKIDGVTDSIKTPIDDGDPDMPCWQCPQTGLAIHDLVWKHRPVLYVGDNEDVAPNGPCYPFEASFTTNRYRLVDSTGIDGPAWDSPPDNYAAWGSFPDPDSDFTTESYKYEVLESSVSNADNDLEDLYIDMLGQNESWLNKPIIQGNIDAYLCHRGTVDGNHVFVQFWQYATASYAPYGFGDNFVHDGDWEMVQFCVQLQEPNAQSCQQAWLIPWAATACQHYYGQTLAWRWDKEGKTDGKLTGMDNENQRYVQHADNDKNRFEIFIAENAHATYFKKDDIDVDADAKTEIQIQYDNDMDSYYDSIGTPIQRGCKLIPLCEKDLAGIYDWPGRWGEHHDASWVGYHPPRGPLYRQVHSAGGNFEPVLDPARLHEECRKHVDSNGDFDENGDNDSETELNQL